jgi:hypothetical protein
MVFSDWPHARVFVCALPGPVGCEGPLQLQLQRGRRQRQQQRRSMEQQRLLDAFELADAIGGTREQLVKKWREKMTPYKYFLCVVQVRAADRGETLLQT